MMNDERGTGERKMMDDLKNDVGAKKMAAVFGYEAPPMPTLVLPVAAVNTAPTRAYEKPRMKTVDRATVIRLIGVVKGL